MRWIAVTAALGLAACGDGPRGELATSIASGVGESATSDTTSGGAEEPADSGATGTGSSLPKFDVGGGQGTAGGGDGSPCGEAGDIEFSFIWIANTNEGTVSKIDTQTTLEVARYRTGPTVEADPSRTSVNLLGDVAVVNRGRGDELGSIIKIAAQLDDCVDLNVDGMIQTSTGETDVLPWGEDECVLWSQPLPTGDGGGSPREGPRPVAWEPAVDEATCEIGENPRVWVGWFDGTAEEGVFRRLDGATGNTLDEVHVQGWNANQYGPYGGAVNREGDLFAIGHGAAGKLVHIDAETLTYDLVDNPGSGFSHYGIALDGNGEVWIGGRNGGVFNYDPVAKQWTNLGILDGVLRGVQVDRQGRAWIAGNSPCRLIEVDTNTKMITNTNIPIPGCNVPVGISIDLEGYVWVVDHWANTAFKVHPDTYQVEQSPANLFSPYTYSDMTGGGLRLVAIPPQG